MFASMDTHPLVDAASQPKAGQEAESSNHQGQISKKAQKRAAKAARLHELKFERRAREKVAKKNKRREQAQAIANGDPDKNTARKRRRINGGGKMELFNARVVVDLGFDELMSDKEINSLTSQLAYTYSANRHAAHAFSVLIFTSLNGRTRQRLDAINDAGYRRWSRTEWWEEGYDRLWTEPSQPPQLAGEEASTQGSLMLAAQADRKKIVYLTADSSEELLELGEGETYIIGGICDHNRYKNLCLTKANDSQIRHARLPIGRYISLATRKVLTVNQVFEILLKWIDTRNWEEAFWAVIPKRKFQAGWRDQAGGKDRNMEPDDDGGHGSNTDDDEEAIYAKDGAEDRETDTAEIRESTDQ
ncbi:guanine-1-methyltransferase-domain-containing protein [Butyriboletus roseoflavus]|nr:guanine-1-methyltransferase-domain-containing protein [Butyriboletus roseoflavus]